MEHVLVLPQESLATGIAHERCLLEVDPGMALHVTVPGESLPTDITGVAAIGGHGLAPTWTGRSSSPPLDGRRFGFRWFNTEWENDFSFAIKTENDTNLTYSSSSLSTASFTFRELRRR